MVPRRNDRDGNSRRSIRDSSLYESRVRRYSARVDDALNREFNRITVESCLLPGERVRSLDLPERAAPPTLGNAWSLLLPTLPRRLTLPALPASSSFTFQTGPLPRSRLLLPRDARLLRRHLLLPRQLRRVP